MRILVLSSEYPFPVVGGGRVRTYQLLRALAARHDLTLVGFDCDNETEPPPFPMQVFSVPWEWPPLYKEMYYGDPDAADRAAEILTCEIDEPWFVSICGVPSMDTTLRHVAEEKWDMVLIDHSHMGRFLGSLPPSVPKILNLHNVYSLMARRTLDRTPSDREAEARREAERTLRFERRIASACALCLTCSEVEASAVRALLGVEPVQVVPNGVDSTFFAPWDGPSTSGQLLFTGTMDYEPNVEAVAYFVGDVLPLIRRQDPTAAFHIVGQRPLERVCRLASNGVTVHGGVPDMRPYYRSAELVVVPLLHGGGTRLKILEAAACGKAIVTTSIGAEGLDFASGKDLIVADTPSDFAEAVISLRKDAGRRRELGRQARRRSLEYDWEGIGRRFCEMVESVQ